MASCLKVESRTEQYCRFVGYQNNGTNNTRLAGVMFEGRAMLVQRPEAVRDIAVMDHHKVVKSVKSLWWSVL